LLLDLGVNFEAKDTRHIFVSRRRWTQLAKSLQEEVRKCCAKKGAVNVIAARHVVIIQLLASRAKQLQWILSAASDGVAETDGEHGLLLT